MLDELDQAVLEVAYWEIDRSEKKWVTGQAIWEQMRATGIAPVMIPARLKRLVSQGLLRKDEVNSGSRTKLYLPTDAGYERLNDRDTEPA